MASEEQAEEACKSTYGSIIEAAENSNQAGDRNAAVRAAELLVRLRRPKDEGLIATAWTADFLNTELRMNYGGHLQVEVDDDWRTAY